MYHSFTVSFLISGIENLDLGCEVGIPIGEKSIPTSEAKGPDIWDLTVIHDEGSYINNEDLLYLPLTSFEGETGSRRKDFFSNQGPDSLRGRRRRPQTGMG